MLGPMTSAATTALATLERIAPIAIFLLAIAVVAELSDRFGVFDVVGHWLARRGRHRAWLLWLLFALFAVSCTVFLSLDTTAVLLTPIGLAIAQQIGVPPRAFALTTLWIANTGSLLLPVSNLTNLLALGRFEQLGIGHAGYVRLAWLPALASVLATLALILVMHRRTLASGYTIDPPSGPHDRTLLVVGMVVCAIVGPAFAIGLPPWLVALVAAAVLVIAAATRAPDQLRGLPVPWLMTAAFSALATVVALAHAAGWLAWLTGLMGQGSDAAALFRVAGVTALASNGVNNLPAYVAVEPAVAEHPARLFAALIGANAGPLVTPWASLATLLWLQRCRAAGVQWRPHRLALAGLVCALIAVGAATLALWLRF